MNPTPAIQKTAIQKTAIQQTAIQPPDAGSIDPDLRTPARIGREADATIAIVEPNDAPEVSQEACLVQIYPADVVDGMLMIDDSAIILGRDMDADLVIDDSSVSRRHAKIERRGEVCYLIDLDSTNGTQVNDQTIGEHPLTVGDTIAVGGFRFKYLSSGCVESLYHETVYSALTRDALTGTFNKRYLVESMQRELIRARRHRQPVAVVMLDIDHFKSVNDTHGHLVGDEVLRVFGQRITQECRGDDLLARYGGEEFCLLMSDTHAEEARRITERCRVGVASERFETEAGPLAVTASFGLACVAELDESVTVEGLLSRADQQLYAAKRDGRNRVCVDTGR